MNKKATPNWEEIICWFETNDFEEMKGKIQAQKAEWKHEAELETNKKEVSVK